MLSQVLVWSLENEFESTIRFAHNNKDTIHCGNNATIRFNDKGKNTQNLTLLTDGTQQSRPESIIGVDL